MSKIEINETSEILLKSRTIPVKVGETEILRFVSVFDLSFCVFGLYIVFYAFFLFVLS